MTLAYSSSTALPKTGASNQIAPMLIIKFCDVSFKIDSIIDNIYYVPYVVYIIYDSMACSLLIQMD